MPRHALAVAAVLAAFLAPPAAAQDAAPEGDAGALALELDGLLQVEGACRLTFQARNGLGAGIGALVIEAVALGGGGGVERIALFDFRDLPADRLRVRQFDLPDMDCGAVGAVLVNGVQACEAAEGGAGAAPALDPAACARALSVSSRTDVELLG